jgi:hypothetical protein
MNYTVLTYLAYLAISVSLAIWVGQTLHKNGRIFLVDAFAGNEGLAESINHQLLVGYNQIKLGYTSLALRFGGKPEDLQGLLEELSTKIGVVLLVLGGMHFFNLYVFSRMRRKAMLHSAPPPLPADSRTTVIG